MAIPDTLQFKIDHFRNGGRILFDTAELFQKHNWLAVLVGQEIWPERCHPLVELGGRADAAKILEQMRRAMEQAAQSLPTHRQYIERHCRARAAAPAADRVAAVKHVLESDQ